MRYNPILKPCKLLQQPHGFPPGGEGGTEQSSMGGSTPRSNPLPSYEIPFWQKRHSFHLPSFDKYCTPFTYLVLNFVSLFSCWQGTLSNQVQWSTQLGLLCKRMHNKVNAEIKQAFYYFITTNLANLMANCIKTWQVINELILLINPAGLLLRN